ncbi:unnamed protein product [Heterobilharzia americana]|nr:unnamed protein product [Heterobilharzia americana]
MRGHQDRQPTLASMAVVGLNLQKIQSVIQECVERDIKRTKISNENVTYTRVSPTVITNKQIPEEGEEVEELFEEIQDSLYVSTGPCSDTDQMTISNETLIRNASIDNELSHLMQICKSSAAYNKYLEFRSKLPAYQIKEDIVSTVQDNQVVIISGETGCGKTTQVPQFILEDRVSKGNGSVTRIVVTQPRRISAISVAERVAAERGQSIGSSVGYQVRLERRYPQRPHGSILFCTTGIVLQWFRSDPLLKNVSHIIVDEVHEREFLCDFLLCMLKRIAPFRPDLRIILMSATINAERFSEYFDNCPKFEIPGRTFPVKICYLEDVLKETNFWLPNNAIATLSRDQSRTTKQHLLKSNISRKEASILSYGKSSEFNRWLKSVSGLSSNAVEILRGVGEDSYPQTDLIAHSVEHILQNTQWGAILVFVPGLVDIKDTIQSLRALNPRRYNELNGNVRIYPLHSRLPTSRDRSLFEPPPHGKRKVIISTNIAETSVTIQDVVYVIDCGRIKVTDYDPRQNTFTLTPILVSKANASQRCGRAGRVQPGICYHLFSSYVYNNVMSDFLQPEMLRVRLEDIILRIKNYKGINSHFDRRQFCQKYFLNERTINEIIRLMFDYASLLHERKYIATPNPSDSDGNRNQWNISLFRAIMCAGLYPNIVKADPRFNKDGRPKLPAIMACPSEGKASVHPSSVNSKIQPTEPLWMIYFTKTKLDLGSCPTIFDSTVVSLRPLLFFTGNIEISKEDKSLFTIDEWIKFSGELKVVNMLKELRKCMDSLLEQKFRSPSVANWDETSKEGRLLRTIVDLLTSEPPPAAQFQNVNNCESFPDIPK